MPQRFLYPALNSLRSGSAPSVKTDAIGRRVLRVDQEKHDIGRQAPDQTGGTPEVRGPEHMVPHLLKAARKLNLPPQHATGPVVMDRIKRLGIVPQKMARVLGTSDPKQQAELILQRRGRG